MRKRNWGLMTVVGLAIIGLCVWGVTETLQKNKYKRLVDGMYEKAFYNLADNMENLEVKLEKLLIAENTATGNKLIADIWRQSYSVSESLAQIPAGAGSLEETMAFVNRLGEYCMSLTYKDEISDEDWDNLRGMLTVCKALAEDIEMLRTSAVAGSYTLSQPLTSAGELPMDGIAMNGVDYPTLIYDGPFSDSAKGPALGLPGFIVSEDEAKSAAVRFIGEERVKSIALSGEDEGEIPTFNFTVTLNSNLVVQAAVTKQGGIMLWMLPESIPANVNLQMDEAEAYAAQFMKTRGLETMEMVHWQVFGSVALLTYVDVAYEMLIYPDMIKVQVSLDTGEVIGYEAGNYVRSHRMRGYPDMLVSEEEAIEKASKLESKQVRLCLIPLNDREIPCYEIKGQFEGSTYFMYVDTLTGELVNVLKLVDTSEGTLTI